MALEVLVIYTSNWKKKRYDSGLEVAPSIRSLSTRTEKVNATQEVYKGTKRIVPVCVPFCVPFFCQNRYLRYDFCIAPNWMLCTFSMFVWESEHLD